MAKEVQVVEEYDANGRPHTVSRTVKNTAKAGISFGSCLAIVISYNAWHSILWAIFHGLLGWIYVVYYALVY